MPFIYELQRRCDILIRLIEKENGAIQYVPGKRSHAQLAYYRGKLYVNHKSNDKTEYKRCRHTRKGCPGRIAIDRGNGGVREVTFHTCTDSMEDMVTLKAQAQLKEEVRANPKPLRQLFHDNLTHKGVQQVSFVSMEATLQRCRRKSMPGPPESAAAAAKMLLEGDVPAAFSQFVKAIGSPTIVFWSEKVREATAMEQRLGPPARMQADATFSFVPTKFAGGFFQFLTVICDYRGTWLPAAFALMASKKKEEYDWVFKTVKEKMDLQTPGHLMTDYELALMQSAGAAYPETRLVGCHFHHAQAVFKNVSTLGLRGLFKQFSGKEAPSLRAVRGQHEGQLPHALQALAALPGLCQGEEGRGIRVHCLWIEDR